MLNTLFCLFTVFIMVGRGTPIFKIADLKYGGGHLKKWGDPPFFRLAILTIGVRPAPHPLMKTVNE